MVCQTTSAQDTSTNTFSPLPLYPAVETNEAPAELPTPAASSLPTQRPGGTSQLSVPSPVPLSPVPPILRWGPLTLQTIAFYRLSYGNGLQASPGQSANTIVNQFSPGLNFQYGSHWSLNYTPTFTAYSSRDLRDTFDNSVVLTGGTIYEDWTLNLSQSYASYSDPIIETASQLNQETYATGLNANYQMGSQISLQLQAGQNFRFIDNAIPGEELSDVHSWSTMDWLNYQFWSRFGAAIGAGFGYDELAVGPDMMSEQLQGRITWVVVKKLSFMLSGGAEDRQFRIHGVPDLLSPIFAFSAQYAPFDTTTLSVSASRYVSPSFFQDEITEGTSLSASLRQRLLGKLFLDLNGGYASTIFHASTPFPFTRNLGNYSTTSFTARLTTAVLRRGTAAIFYSVNYISSGASIFNYTTTQVGLELSYRY